MDREKAEIGGQVLSHKQARQIGENVQKAVNAGELALGEEQYFATSGEFDNFNPSRNTAEAVEKAAIDLVSGMFRGNKTMQEKILKQWEKERTQREQKRSWDNYIGKALAEKEPGSMMSAEEQAELESETRKRSQETERRVDLLSRVREKLRGEKSGVKMRRKAIGGMATTLAGMMLFLSACGKEERFVERSFTPNGLTMKNGEDDFEESGAEEFDEGQGLGAEDEAEVGVEVDSEGDDEEAEVTKSFNDILELSKKLDFEQLTDDDLRIAGTDDVREQKFLEKEDARTLDNGVQLSFADYYSPDKTEGKYSFGPSNEWIYDLEENRTEVYINNLLDEVWTQPLTLASSVVNLPTIMRAAGISDDTINIQDPAKRAQAVADMMIKDEDGGDLQKRLRGAYKIALMNSETACIFYLENGPQNTFYYYPIDSTTQENPETNLKIALQKNKMRIDEKEAQLVFTFADGHKETSTKHLSCGDQEDFKVVVVVWNNIPVKIYVPKTAVEDVPVMPESTPVPEVIFVPEEEATEDREEEIPEAEPEEGEPEQEEREEENPEDEVEEEEVEEKEEESEDPEDNEPEEDEDEEPEESEEKEPEIPEESVKPKDEEGQQKVVDDGGQTNPVGQTPNVDDLADQGIQEPSNEEVENSGVEATEAEATTATETETENEGEKQDEQQVVGDTTGTYEVTEQPIVAEGNREQVEAEQVADQTASEEEQRQAEAKQDEANLKEKVDDMSDDEFLKFMEEFLNGLK